MKHIDGVWGYVWLFFILNLMMNFVINFGVNLSSRVPDVTINTNLEMAIKVFALLTAAFLASGRFKVIEQRNATESETLRIAVFGFIIGGGLILLVGLLNILAVANAEEGVQEILPRLKWFTILLLACFGGLYLFFGPLLKFRNQ